MASLSEYFAQNRYKPTYLLGDRVRGFWNGIPFTGSVAIDSKVYEHDDPTVMVFSDLPIEHNSTVYTLLKCKHEELQSL